MNSLSFAIRALLLSAVSAFAPGCQSAGPVEPGAPTHSADDHGDFGTHTGALTAEQCSFFAEGDKVTICHKTSSAKKPYTVIRTNVASCGGHSLHAGDYVGYNDPTCNGQGCFPAGAPFDGSVECCEGLSPQAGVCAVAPCPASASGGPACVCDPGYSGALAWSFSSTAWTGDCADNDECAADSAACAPGTTCANTPGSFTCTAPPPPPEGGGESGEDPGGSEKDYEEVGAETGDEESEEDVEE